MDAVACCLRQKGIGVFVENGGMYFITWSAREKFNNVSTVAVLHRDGEAAVADRAKAIFMRKPNWRFDVFFLELSTFTNT